LMRKFHPDGKGEAQDPRTKEINEAYGVLKHSSTRVEYDLRRAYQRKKRRLYLQRVVTPPAILIILGILGLIYLQRPRVAPLKESKTLPVRDLTHMKVKLSPSSQPSEAKEINSINPKNSTDQAIKTDETNQIDEMDQTNQIAKKSPEHQNGPAPTESSTSPKVTTRPNQISKKDEIKQITETNEKNQLTPDPTSVPKDRKAMKTSLPVLEAKTSTPNRKSPSLRPKGHKSLGSQGDENMPAADLSIETKKRPARKKPIPLIPKSETSAKVHGVSPKPIAEGSEIKRNERPEPKPVEDITDPNDMDEHKRRIHIKVDHFLIAPSSSISIEKQMAQHKSASLLATEEEVKQFFTLYIDRYMKKDIDGFHSLFSSKALQNGKDELNQIKKIYSNFFNQSQEVRYHMEGTRIEIYQNAVHVKARYIVNQRLKKGKENKVWRGDISWILVRENGALRIRYLDYKQQNPRHSGTKALGRPQSTTYAKDRR